MCSALGAVALACSIVGLVLPKSNKLENETTITIKGDTARLVKTLDVSLYDINPGCQKYCAINFDRDDISSFNISLAFFKDESAGNLDRFLNIAISANEFSANESLSEILENKKSYSLGKGIETISIVFSMPEDVGNESQGAAVDFHIDLEAKRN